MSCARILGLAASALFSMPAMALADVTPEQVWENWQAMSTASGYTMTAESQRREGGTLVLAGVTMRAVAGDAEAGAIDITMPMGEVRMEDLGDGRVEVVMEPSYTVAMQSTDTEGRPFAMRMRVDQVAMRTIVSGEPAAPRHDFTAESVRVVLEEMMAEGKPMPLTLDAMIEGIGGHYAAATGDDATMEAEIAATKMAVAMTAENPDSPGGRMTLTYESADLAGTFAGTLVDQAMAADLSALLAAGFNVDSEFTQGATRFDLDFADGDDSLRATGTLGGAGLWMLVDAAQVDYGTSADNVDVALSGSSIPFPELKVKLAEYLFGIALPIAPAPEPGDMSLMARLVGLTVSDDVWAMLDPQALLPRDPATLIVDAKGKLKVLMNLFTPETSVSPETPAEIQSLDLAELRVEAVGAQLTGSGALTFDNTDTATYGGMPKPIGAVDLSLTGGETLLDRLVQLQLVDAEQAAGFKMLAPLFAQPGPAPDSLTTRIEFQPDGSILANGQRIQ